MCRSRCQCIMYLGLSSSDFCSLFPILKIWSFPSTQFCFPFENLKYNLLSIFIVVYWILRSIDFFPYSDFCFKVFHLQNFVVETWRMTTIINIPPLSTETWEDISCRLPWTNSPLYHNYSPFIKKECFVNVPPFKMQESTN